MVVSAKTEMEITPTHTYKGTHHTTLTTATSARLNCVKIIIFFHRFSKLQPSLSFHVTNFINKYSAALT